MTPHTNTNTPNTLENMFATQEKHSLKHDETDKKHEKYELTFEEHARQIRELQTNAIRLENVVMSESRDTRSTITTTNQQLVDLINNLMGYNSGQNQLTTNLKLAKYESYSKIIGILAGSGGILYYIFT